MKIEKASEEVLFPSIGLERLRMLNDGEGVTTLAAAYGCPLRCRYCLNPQCFAEAGPVHTYTVGELMELVKIDDLYFQATGGGIIFGGGEPLLYADFIHQFRKVCPAEWKIGLESSLAIDRRQLEKVIEDIDYYLIDIKDMEEAVYREYTGRDNTKVMQNLEFLSGHVAADKITIRIPLIRNFNNKEKQEHSRRQLLEMGFRNFDMFAYDVEKAREKADRIRKKSVG